MVLEEVVPVDEAAVDQVQGVEAFNEVVVEEDVEHREGDEEVDSEVDSEEVDLEEAVSHSHPRHKDRGRTISLSDPCFAMSYHPHIPHILHALLSFEHMFGYPATTASSCPHIVCLSVCCSKFLVLH